MRLSVPQAPRWLVAGDEANKAVRRDAPFPAHLDSIQLVHARTIRPAVVPVPCLASERRYFVLSPPPFGRIAKQRNRGNAEEKKSQTRTYQPFLKPSLMVARSSDDTQTPIWGDKRRRIDREGETCGTWMCV
ncbi:hypothetical protein LI328DRAFT_5457 [Trichoderma asperelloides]|nr:hypothetical protein LI328DRAFT_5457 [Trichoderma asperelloides]